MEKLELGKEYIPPNEAEAIATVLDINQRILNTTEKPFVRRGEHPKSHGCVRGVLTVEHNLRDDAQLRVGIFQDPGKSFPVCLRFSNFSVQDDAKGDTRGVGIKVFNVSGEKILDDEKNEQTQDILLVDLPVFVVRNAKDYVEVFTEIQRSNSRTPLRFFFPSLNPLTWRLHELRIGLSIRFKTISSLLETQYWSMTPYRFGEQAAKLTLVPSPSNREGNVWNRLKARTKDYLRDRMREHLRDRPASFDLLVQFQTDADKCPIEDPTIPWNSPFYKIATIAVPSQSFESPEQERFCEHLSFTPWHSLPEHRPLGGINRTRKTVYETISRLRNQLNQVEHREPSVDEFMNVFPIDTDK